MALTPAVTHTDHRLGNPEAVLTLVEYGDYECPYCGQAYESLKQVKAALGDKLLFVFRNFPLKSMHPRAEAAAWLAEGAAQSGVFWEVHDRLYEHQANLENDDLVRYGRQAGMPDAVIEEALEGAFAARVEADFHGGVRSGVNGTPCFFINGRRHDGSFEAPSLLTALRHAL